MNLKLERFFMLRRHRARVELALLDAMVDIYGTEKGADEIIMADPRAFKMRVLQDLENATLEAYHAAAAEAMLWAKQALASKATDTSSTVNRLSGQD